MSEIAIVGSLNLDIVVPVERHPAPGETVLGGDHVQLPGGKGANQAVAAARLGRAAAIVGRVGNDDAGARLRATCNTRESTPPTWSKTPTHRPGSR